MARGQRAAGRDQVRLPHQRDGGGNPAFSPLEPPTGSFGAFGRNRGGSMRRHRPAAAPGGRARQPSAAGREAERAIGRAVAESSDPRRSLEQALRDTAVDEQALIEQLVGANRRARATAAIGL